MPSANWQDEYLTMVKDCEQRFGLLDDWEQSFVHSLWVQFDKPRFTVSPKQIEKLEAIWERVTKEMPTVVEGNADLFGKS